MEIDAQHVIDVIRAQRNEALDRVVMLEAALQQRAESEGDEASSKPVSS